MRSGRNGKIGRFRVELELANYQDLILAKNAVLPRERVRRARIKGVVDCGATRLVLPKQVVDHLGLAPVRTIGVMYADKRRARRDEVNDVWLQLLGRDGTFTAIVEPRRDDALIGALVMEQLDLIIDPVTERLKPRDPRGIIAEIE
jgi:predicted aspartyl protease